MGNPNDCEDEMTGDENTRSAQRGAVEAPKLHTLDQEYHLKESETEDVMEKDETWTRKERKEKEEEAMAFAATTSSDVSLPIQLLAAFGFAVSLYGAFKHYTK